MRKLLYLLLIIDILTLAYGFIAILGTSFLYAAIVLILGILEIGPLIALIICLENIGKLQEDNIMLAYKLKKLENEIIEPDTLSKTTYPELKHGETAVAIWECVKCGSVNKAGTSHCSNCKADYSPLINPTDDPYKKRKRSRWIKEKIK